MFTLTEEELRTPKLTYYSDYFSFIGRDDQGMVAFALDNNRGQDKDSWQAEHFVVLHDEGASASRDTPRIAHYQEGDMRDETLESLRTARAAIFYLRDAIVAHEQRVAAAAKGPIGELEVYPHHVIRGGERDEA